MSVPVKPAKKIRPGGIQSPTTGAVAADGRTQGEGPGSGPAAVPLLEACIPITEFGGAWPTDAPVQIHGMDADPFFAGEGDVDATRTLVETATDAELFLHPGDSHLFTDSSLPSYDEQAAKQVNHRVLGFLDRIK
ncbi:hypothetical protein E4K10_45125 [Streptomyces sp. T1317-0309]|nr:hypothetical protein E4K10_47505 [Streptomyces sp. T1317-0309]TFV34158.1 hypothetical protein E4K10_45125 [Streptomyces sp. T1317-0309]